MKCALRYMARKFWSEHGDDLQLALFAIALVAVAFGIATICTIFPIVGRALALLLIFITGCACGVGIIVATGRACAYLKRLYKEAAKFCKGDQ